LLLLLKNFADNNNFGSGTVKIFKLLMN